MRTTTIAAIIAAALTLGCTARAAQVSGVNLPDQVTVENKTLKLNGVGLRQATILKINVYAAGLYLQSTSHDAEAIAKSDEPKAIEMVFLRDVSAKQISDALKEGLDKNCEGDCSNVKAALGQVTGSLKDIQKGGKMSYRFLADRVDLFVNNAKVASIDGKDASRQLIRCWIGRNPPNAGLKQGFLGVTKS